MLNLLLLICCGLLADAQVIISYLGTITGSNTGPWSAGDNLMINFTLTAGVTANTTMDGSGNSVIQWGYTNSTMATTPLAFSMVQIILKKNSASPPAFNGKIVTSTAANFNALAVGVTTPSTISLYMNSSDAGKSSLPSISGFVVNAINIKQNFGLMFPTTASELTSFFGAVAFNASTAPSGTSDTITYFNSAASGTIYTLTLTPLSLIVSAPRPGDPETPEEFQDADSFKGALKLLGIKFGTWDLTSFNITITGVLTFGSYTFAFYNVDDGELGPIVISLGKIKVKKWGNGVKKGCLGIFGPSDVAAATGFSFTVPSGLTEIMYSVIARFSSLNVVISDGEFNLEITGSVLLKYFYHFKTGEKKGKKIGKEEGSTSACDSPSTFCFSITIPSTSTVGSYTGTEGSSSGATPIPKAYAMWALLLPAFLYRLW